MILFYLNILYCNIYIFYCLKSVILEFWVWIQTSFRFGGLFDWNFCNIKPYRWSNCHWETEERNRYLISHVINLHDSRVFFFFFVAKLDTSDLNPPYPKGSKGRCRGEDRTRSVGWWNLKMLSMYQLRQQVGLFLIIFFVSNLIN
jgi:hypothetical protein